MNVKDIRKFDLNLLVVFDVILKERSTVVAGERLGLSQSAVSHALARLRRLIGDELFTRDDLGLQPTARAIELATPVQQALGAIAEALVSREFIPAQAARTLTVAASDYSCTVIIPRLIERIAAAAPNVDLRVVPASRLDVIRQLDEARIDVAIGWFAAVPARFGRATVVEEDWVFIARTHHPLLAGEVSQSRILSYPHIVVDYTGNADNLIDGFFPERGVLRRVHIERVVLEAPRREGRTGRIAVRVPSFATVADVVAQTDMIASLPRRLAASMCGRHRVVLIEPPGDTSTVDVEILWHWRSEVDPGVRWLRAQIAHAATEVGGASLGGSASG